MTLACLLSLLTALARAGTLAEAPRDLANAVRLQGEVPSLAALSAGGLGTWPALNHDRAVEEALRSRPLGGGARVGETLGEAYTLFVAMGAVHGAGLLGAGEPWTEAGLLGLEALMLSGVETLSLKLIARRDRPDGRSLGFPSMHTAQTFALAAAATSEWGWRASPSFAAAAFVAYSMIEVREHFLSDVVFGAGIGVSAGRASWRARRVKGAPRLTIVPRPGGAAVRWTF